MQFIAYVFIYIVLFQWEAHDVNKGSTVFHSGPFWICSFVHREQ